jgi:hypothetical protein
MLQLSSQNNEVECRDGLDDNQVLFRSIKKKKKFPPKNCISMRVGILIFLLLRSPGNPFMENEIQEDIKGDSGGYKKGFIRI